MSLFDLAIAGRVSDGCIDPMAASAAIFHPVGSHVRTVCWRGARTCGGFAVTMSDVPLLIPSSDPLLCSLLAAPDRRQSTMAAKRTAVLAVLVARPFSC